MAYVREQRGRQVLVTRKLDKVAIHVLLGELQTQSAWELEQQGLSKEEAFEHAKRQILQAMRDSNVDIGSYHDVKRWSESFRVHGTLEAPSAHPVSGSPVYLAKSSAYFLGSLFFGALCSVAAYVIFGTHVSIIVKVPLGCLAVWWFLERVS